MNQSQTIFGRALARTLALAAAAIGSLVLASGAGAAVHGIAGGSGTPTFNLTASAGSVSQPDGALIYAWGYGCNGSPRGFLPATTPTAANCPTMQMPGPTLIVTEGDVVTVSLTNALPPAAGATSILFPGMTVVASTVDATPTGPKAGLLTTEAPVGGTVTYTFTASKPGTYSYYSGTQSDLQIEMGLFGAIVVLPNTNPPQTKPGTSTACAKGPYSLAASAYDNPNTCYDREYLFQFSELSSTIHEQVKAQVDAMPTCTTANPCPQILATMEPYHPNYFLVNGRSMPDDMDVAYSAALPNQPYNGNPHMHPGELLLMRVVGQGHWQHPFHFHGNHARVLARDANLLLSQTANSTNLAGPLLFTIATVSGQTVDAIFTWTGQGLNWDVYGGEPHTCNGRALPAVPGDPSAQSAGFDSTTHEYCLDHGKPIPVTPPDPSIVVNGQWYGGTPYIGLQSANPTPEAPGTLNQNPQAGYAYMWHSHNEREITTNDVFPGGMMMMLLIDPASWIIDETL